MRTRHVALLTLPALLLPSAALAGGYTARIGAAETEIEPIVTSSTPEDYYRYGTTNAASSDTLDGLEVDNVGVFFLLQDPSGDISLVTLLDRFGSSRSGAAELRYTGVAGASWVVRDDPVAFDRRDSYGTPGASTLDVTWAWDARRADGGVLTLAPGDFCVGIEVVSAYQLTDFEIVTPDGAGGFSRVAIPAADRGDIELCFNPDSDGDGVPDDEDDCSDTAPGEIIDDVGCSVADYCPCDDPWRNHGEYVRCVVHTSRDFERDGWISWRERKDLISDAARSDCGKGACGERGGHDRDDRDDDEEPDRHGYDHDRDGWDKRHGRDDRRGHDDDRRGHDDDRRGHDDDREECDDDDRDECDEHRGSCRD